MREVEVQRRLLEIPTPAVFGMSGGRTSAFQVAMLMEATGGNPGTNRVIAFMNTGDEDERSLAFIDRCDREWGLGVVWLEYRHEPFPAWLLGDAEFQELRRRQFANRGDKGLRQEVAERIAAAGFSEQAASILAGRECLNGRDTYSIVDFATASRNREPYQAMLESREAYRMAVKGLRGALPCPSQRLCTGQLKMNVAKRYMADRFGVDRRGYHVALALRSDERDGRADQARTADEAGVPCLPLDDAGIVAADIEAFWQRQPFQLGMKSYEGNCRACFMKKRHALEVIVRKDPTTADFYAGWEARTGDRFRRDRPGYAAMQWQARNQPLLFEEPDDYETVITCEGGYCSD
jgi:hypothetical protein